MNTNIFLSHCLDKHPLKHENKICKSEYINSLNYFVSTFSSNTEFSQGMLKNYSEILNNSSNLLASTEQLNLIKKSIKKICSLRIRKFKFYTYKYVFFCDCLYISAFNHPLKGKEILDCFKNILHKRHHSKLELLYEVLYNNKVTAIDFDMTKYHISCWKRNYDFSQQSDITIMVTATMSAGKSTLINALVGKKITQTQNEACTSKIYSIYNKPYEDNYIYGKSNTINLNLDKKSLMAFNNTKDNNVTILSYMNLTVEQKHRLCIIDTPGINSSINIEHSKVTQKAIIGNTVDKLIYVINSTNAGTNDESKYLKEVFNIFKNKQIIFVINKLDTFMIGDDSILESINLVKKELLKIGFKKPLICPVSAYSGWLFKKILNGHELNEDEHDECAILLKKFMKNEYDLSKYFDKKVNYNLQTNESFSQFTTEDIIKCLYKTGLPNLEYLITRKDA